MKKLIYCVVLLSGVSTFVLAQTPPPAQPNQGPAQRQAGPNHEPRKPGPISSEERAERRASRLTKELSLTPEQTTKVKALFLQQEKEMDSAREKSASATDKSGIRGDMKALHEKHEQELKAILTPEQNTKWEAMQTERKENRQHHGGGRDSTRNGQAK